MAGPSKGKLVFTYKCKLVLIIFNIGIRLSFLSQADQNKYEMVFSQAAGGNNILTGKLRIIDKKYGC